MRTNVITPADALTYLQSLPGDSVHCCVTSPPYWGLRSYLDAEHPDKRLELGSEPTLSEYLDNMAAIFSEVRRVLRSDGVAWINMGDGYAQSSGRDAQSNSNHKYQHTNTDYRDERYSGGVNIRAPMTIKDMVRLDPATVQLWNGERWCRVHSWEETPRPDNPIELVIRSGERIGCTPDHRWPTQRGEVCAKDLQIGDYLKESPLPEPGKPLAPGCIPDALGWFVGLFIAEGSYGKGGVVIQIASHVNEQSRFDRLSQIVEDYGGTIRWHNTGGDASTMNIYSNVLAGILSDYVSGKNAKHKHLSPKCWQRSNSFLENVLQGYLQGDGHYRENGEWRLGFTNNDNWAEDLRCLTARLGYSMRLQRTVHTCNGKAYPGYRGSLFVAGSHRRIDTEIIDVGKSRARKFWNISLWDDPHTFCLASGVVTKNSNPMPESVTDRPTKSHEYVFLMSKAPRYYYDAFAIREAANYEGDTRHLRHDESKLIGNPREDNGSRARTGNPTHGRNKRTVWTVATHSFSAAHFATFPPKLIEPMILAGCPPKVCSVCQAPWVRVVERVKSKVTNPRPFSKAGNNDRNDTLRIYEEHDTINKGWRPTCDHPDAPTEPGIVLDPFMGSGTVALVAIQHGRRWLGCELNPDYIEIANERISTVQVDMFTSVGL